MSNFKLISQQILITSGICFTGLSFTGCSEVKSEKPNIIFVFSDQQSAFELSSYLGGDSVVQTPNLDRLAKEGIQFTNYVSNNPVCVPFRATLITGQYGQNNGLPFNTTRSVPDNKPGLQPDHPLFPLELKNNGYKMGYVGKWHLYPESEQFNVVPEVYRYGFTDCWRKSSNYQDRYNTGYYDDEGNFNKLDGYAPAAQMDQLIEFVKASKDVPFCAVLSWHPPHPSYRQAPEKWVKYYESKTIRYRENVPDKEKSEKLITNIIGAYSHVSAMDEEIGKLMNVLRELKIDKNTIVIYSSDHGDMLGSQGWYNKRTPWNESIQVPFIVRWPGGIKITGRKESAPLSSVDLAPTFLGLAGIEPPAEMDGVDYSGFIKDPNQKGPESAFLIGIAPYNISEKDQQEHLDNKKMAYDWRGIYTSRYTYAVRKENGKIIPWLLYDNEKDPYQINNLVEEKESRKIIPELKDQLEKYLSSVRENDWITESAHEE